MQKIDYERESLERDDVGVDHFEMITERRLESRTCLECIIENYSNLKESTCYTMIQEVSGRECTLKLRKTKEFHIFQFHCELSNNSTFFKQPSTLKRDKMVFHVMYDRCEPIWPGDLIETNHWRSIEVPSEVVLHADNKYLSEKNILVVQFSHGNYVSSRPPINRYGNVTKTDQNALSDEFLSLYESGKFTDFVFRSRDGKKFRVHKLICKARSKFFRTTLEEPDQADSPGIYVNSESRILERVVRYMYTDELEDMPLDDLLKVSGVATCLGLTVLRHSLAVAVIEKLDDSNARRVQQTAERLFMRDLLSYIKGFLRKNDDENEEGLETESSAAEIEYNHLRSLIKIFKWF